MLDEYVSKAEIHRIVATSRASVKIKDSYYTLEYQEERIFPDRFDNDDIDIDKERQILWDEVNNQVDQQISDTVYAVTGKR